MSFDKLQDKIDEMRSPVVAALDPALGDIPQHILQRNIREHGNTLWAAALSVSEMNIMLINALYDIVPAIKLQVAFFEALGAEGMVSMEMTSRYAASKGMYVIFDGNRNAVGPAANAYSSAYLGAVMIGGTELRPYSADALTINIYPGSDSLKPFIEAAVKHDRAVFAVIRTPASYAGELSDMWVCRNAVPATYVPQPLYTEVGDMLENLSAHTIGRYGYTRAGAVVAASPPGELTYLRARLRRTFFLVTDYDARMGAAADVEQAFDENRHGAIVEYPRTAAAWKDADIDYADAARADLLQFRAELRAILSMS